MARSNENNYPQPRRYTVEQNGVFSTVRALSWSAAVTLVCPDARPISWKVIPDPAWCGGGREEPGGYILVNETIRVYELV
jgi:hypothetical protein